MLLLQSEQADMLQLTENRIEEARRERSCAEQECRQEARERQQQYEAAKACDF